MDNNIYNNPEKFGLSILRSIDTAGAYEFDILLVLEDSAGKLFWITDSGCSCPMPFEGVGVSDLHELTVDTYATFQEMLREWEEQDDGNALDSAARVDIEKIVVRKLMPKLAQLLDAKDIIVDEDDDDAPPIARPWMDSGQVTSAPRSTALEIPSLGYRVWRVTALQADEYGRVRVTLTTNGHVGGIMAEQTLEFTTLDPPNLGAEFTITAEEYRA